MKPKHEVRGSEGKQDVTSKFSRQRENHRTHCEAMFPFLVSALIRATETIDFSLDDHESVVEFRALIKKATGKP